MIDTFVAAQVRHQWAAAGAPRCDHVKFDWEQLSGVATGNLVCLRCGALALYEELRQKAELHKLRCA